jgi:hypothetical protein
MDIDEENYFNTSDDEDDNTFESTNVQMTESSLEANDKSSQSPINNDLSLLTNETSSSAV